MSVEQKDFSPETLEYLLDRIHKLKHASRRPFLISIAGGSCTGKSTQIGQALCSAIGAKTTRIQQDDYQLGKAGIGRLDPQMGADDPQNYGIREATALLKNLRVGREGTMPKFSFRDKVRVGSQQVVPRPYILFEGLYALSGSLAGIADLGMYVEMSFWGRLCRRILRNTRERYVNYPVDKIIQGFLDRVEPAHKKYNTVQKNHADILLHHAFELKDSISYFQLNPVLCREGEDVIFCKEISTQACLKVVQQGMGGEFQLHYQNQCYLNEPIPLNLGRRLASMENK